jgi:hypothetical protein
MQALTELRRDPFSRILSCFRRRWSKPGLGLDKAYVSMILGEPR